MAGQGVSGFRPEDLSEKPSRSNVMKALKLVWAAVRFVGHAAWGLLTLAGQKPDDEECGVDLGGQGRVSWRSGR